MIHQVLVCTNKPEQDLDTYISVPDDDPDRDACQITYKTKKCNKV